MGKLAVNCLNAYGGLMTILTTATAFTKTARVPQWVRTVCVGTFISVSVLIALLASADFLANFRNFVLLLLLAFTPWSAINLVDYYLISKEGSTSRRCTTRTDATAAGISPRWCAYVIGIAVQIPFVAQELYTGPLVDDLGGADISWLVGLVVTTTIYYLWARKTIEPAGADDLPRRRRDRSHGIQPNHDRPQP